MKRSMMFVACACGLAGTPASAQELSYRLPGAVMVAGWQARITACPTADAPDLVYETSATVAAIPASGELVRLNPASPFLGSRKVSLTFNENGTLKTINAEGEGQGGTILASLFKTAAGALTLGIPVIPGARSPNLTRGSGEPEPKPEPVVVCKADVAKAVERWIEVSDRIEGIEADAANGVPLGVARSSLLESLKAEQAELEDELTLSTSVKLVRNRADAKTRRDAAGNYFEVQGFDALDVGDWLTARRGAALPRMKVGSGGFCAIFSAAAATIAASSPVATFGVRTWRRDNLTAAGTVRSDILQNRFVYLAPVPVDVQLWERTGTGADCAVAAGRGKKLAAKSLSVPQFSDYFILPLGSGVFESKSTSAEFTPEGRLVSIGTSAVGGGTQFAEALAGGLAAAETARDATTGAIQRRIDRIKAENELKQLTEPSATSEVAEPS